MRADLLPSGRRGPAEFAAHEATWLSAWRPRDVHEHEAALAAIRAMWRETRADRLEVQALDDLFAADWIADAAERAAAKDRATNALAMLLRYKARIEREHRFATELLADLRQRRLSQPPARPRPAEPPAHPREPEAAVQPSAPEPAPLAAAAAAPAAALPHGPEGPGLSRHQRRALAAMERRRAA